jgi:hypothetical protein
MEEGEEEDVDVDVDVNVVEGGKEKREAGEKRQQSPDRIVVPLIIPIPTPTLRRLLVSFSFLILSPSLLILSSPPASQARPR